jgi:hypothetical protein
VLRAKPEGIDLIDVNRTSPGQAIVNRIVAANQNPTTNEFAGDASIGIAAAGTATLLGSIVTGTKTEITGEDVFNQAAAWVPAIVTMYNPLVGFAVGLAFAFFQGVGQSPQPTTQQLIDKALAAYSIKLANKNVAADSNELSTTLSTASTDMSFQLENKKISDGTADEQPPEYYLSTYQRIRNNINEAVQKYVSKGKEYEDNKGTAQLYRASMLPLIIHAWNLHSSVLVEMILIQKTNAMRKQYADRARQLAEDIGTFITKAAEDTWQVERRHLHKMGWGDPLVENTSFIIGTSTAFGGGSYNQNCTVRSTTSCTNAFRSTNWCTESNCQMNTGTALYSKIATAGFGSTMVGHPCEEVNTNVCGAPQLKALLEQAKLKASKLKIMVEAITQISNADFHPNDWLCQNSNMKKDDQETLHRIIESGNWQLMSCMIRVQTRKWLDKWDQTHLQALAKKLMKSSTTFQEVKEAGGEGASDSPPKLVEMNPHETYLFKWKMIKNARPCNGGGYIRKSCLENPPIGRHSAGSKEACIKLCDADAACFGAEYWQDGGCHLASFGAELTSAGWFDKVEGVYRMDQKDDGFADRVDRDVV